MKDTILELTFDRLNPDKNIIYLDELVIKIINN
jgi:hypothetical protein